MLACALWLVAAISAANGQGAPPPMHFYESFFRELMIDSPQLARYHEPTELKLAGRLGIEYEGETNKFMIGYGFEESARRLFREEALRYTLTVESLDAMHTALKVEIPQLGLTKRFYFKGRQLISPVQYHAEHWIRRYGRYVEFWVRDSTLLHPVAIEELDSFIERMLGILACSNEERATLAQQKIIYVLCRNEDDVERLTGFRSRGMYLLPYDYIVTSYPCHFHEVAHLLVNFTLQRLPLYTHPMLQEGFAAAFGGRGGIAASTLRRSGAFLVASSAVNVRDLFVAETFRQYDPSISYAVSGLYVQFLIEAIGMKGFLHLYRKYSGTAEQVQRMMLHNTDLPSHDLWRQYAERVARAAQEADIMIDAPLCSSAFPTAVATEVSLAQCGEFLHVRTKHDFALVPPTPDTGCRTRLAEELGLEGEALQAQFYIHVDSQEVVVYDVFAGNSIASYARGFTLDGRGVPGRNGFYEFWIRKKLLPAKIDGFRIVVPERRRQGE